jgi:ankyrin repeat protein
MRYLVFELGADVNQAEVERGQTVLHMACYAGRFDVLQCLLGDLNADVDKGDNSDGTALFFAVEAGHLNLMRWLVLEFGADINHTDDYGETVLMVYIAAGREYAVLT